MWPAKLLSFVIILSICAWKYASTEKHANSWVILDVQLCIYLTEALVWRLPALSASLESAEKEDVVAKHGEDLLTITNIQI